APSPLEIPGPETIAPPARALPGTDDLGEDLVTLWSYLQSESVRLAEDGTWSEPHRAAFLSRFVQPVETRLRMIEHLAREQDWIHVDERGMLRPVPGPMMEWLRGGRQMQWATLARVWRDSVRWNDLAMAPSLGPDPLLDWPNDPAAARHNFLAHLQHCKAGVWYTLSNLVQHVYQYATDFLRPDGDYDAWNLQDRATGAPVKGFDSWYAVEGALIVFFVVGPLSWLGLVDLGWTLPGLPPDAFRINDAGAAFLGLDGSFELPEPPPVHIAPDGLLAAPPGRRYERFQLGRIAVQVSSGAAAQYRLTPRSLSRARAQRIPLERIVDFLDEATEGRLPAALRKAVERAYHGGVQARLGRVWVLRVEDPELLDYPEIRELLQERLGPRVALVRETDRERLLSLLVQEGILPELDER
ncbi:MAG: helicase-associated domain-containing protein, partial [Anaerolineae bacterium]|nr:helicase-associated domain-containing protein [Anaerolineae bacterium]